MSSTPQIDRATVIRSFNDYFFEFLDDMLKVLPNNKSVLTAIRSFRMLTDVNKGILIKSWYKCFLFLPDLPYIQYSHPKFFPTFLLNLIF